MSTEHELGARRMMQHDRASSALGMVVHRDDPGHAVVSMRVRDDMLNGLDVAHGGLIFALADTAFAIACNDDVTMTFAAGAEITFLAPARLGDTLTGTAAVRSRAGRTGIYDVTVVDASARPIAEFRGHSRDTGKPLVLGGVAHE